MVYDSEKIRQGVTTNRSTVGKVILYFKIRWSEQRSNKNLRRAPRKKGPRSSLADETLIDEGVIGPPQRVCLTIGSVNG
jgi:hypothetical protein